MSAKEAYEKVCEYMNERPVVVMCREYRNVFGFFVTSPDAVPGSDAYVGSSMICVDKTKGDVFTRDDPRYAKLYGTRWIRVN